MARPIPVGPRDVAYQAALASGKGVVRDVATIAADPDAPLERKVRIFRAASTMTQHDRARFDGIIDALAPQAEEPPLQQIAAPVLPEMPPTPDPDPTTPTGRTQDPPDPDRPELDRRQEMRTNVRTIEPFTIVPTRKLVRADTGRTRRVSEETRQKRLEVAREILATNRTIGVRELGRRIALATKHRISLSTVSTLRASVLADLERERRTAPAVRS